MDIEGLKYFVAVAEQENFTRAAELCNITQTAMSQHIRNMEKALKFRLFERSTRHVTLTPAGEAFLEQSRSIIQQYSAAVDRCKSIAAGEVGSVSLLLPGYAEGMLLMPRLSLFREKYPNTSLEVHYAAPRKILDMIRSKQTDLVVFWPYDFKENEFQVYHVSDFRFDLICSNDHEFADRKEISLSEIRDVHYAELNYSALPRTDGAIKKIWLSRGIDTPEVSADYKPYNIDELGLQIALDHSLVALVPEYIKSHVNSWHSYIPVKDGPRFSLSAICQKAESRVEVRNLIDLLTDSRIPLNF